MLKNFSIAFCCSLSLTACSAFSRPEVSPPPTAAPTPVATPEYTPVPTVPPTTPRPAGAKPLPTRPKKNPETENLKEAGRVVGPVVTFAGTARADGIQVDPIGKTADGTPIFRNYIGSGFMMVIEGKRGLSNLEVGRRIFAHKEGDPTSVPDLQVQVTRPLGNGSEVVCDRRRPLIGGVPAIDPPSFATNQKVTDALNDMACRFEIFIEPQSSCVVDKWGDFAFVKEDSSTQFCMVVAKAWNFPIGDTLVSVRLRDQEGNPGPVSRFVLRRPEKMPVRAPLPSPTPTPIRRRP